MSRNNKPYYIGRKVIPNEKTLNELFFYLEPMNEREEKLPNHPLVRVDESDLRKFLPYTTIEKKRAFRKMQDDSLFIFQVKDMLGPTLDYHGVGSVYPVQKSLNYQSTKAIKSFPLITVKTSDENKSLEEFKSFMRNLQTNELSVELSCIPKNRKPSLLFYQDPSLGMYALGKLSNVTCQDEKLHFQLENHLSLAYIPFEILSEMYFTQGTSVFLDESIEEVILSSLQPVDINSFTKKKVSKLKEGFQNDLITEAHEVTSAVVKKSLAQNSSETSFLEQLEMVMVNKNLNYNYKELINFHLAMKTDGLVILGGMSGTGKSQLVRAYAEALGLEKNHLLFLPVSPSWMDESELLGYFDETTQTYRRPSNSFLDMLLEAQDNREQTYIVCFDEMNLAKTEHYFSSFLSILENEYEDRELVLYPKQFEETVRNQIDIPSSMRIGRNIFFVGTVNFDESTFVLSDKVLDRASIINLKVKEFSQLFVNTGTQPVVNNIQKTSLHSFVADKRSQSLNEQELKFLWDLHSLLQEVDYQLGIGPRLVWQFNHYIGNLASIHSEDMTRADALDYLLLQKVIPKLRGSADKLHHLVGDWNSEKNRENSSLDVLMKKYGDLSKFELTRERLDYKAKELADHGYTV